MYSLKDERMWLSIQDSSIDIGEVHSWVVQPSCGAVVLFTGTTRDFSPGRTGITALQYDAYEEQVVPRFVSVAETIFEKWSTVERVACFHRVGLVTVSEVSVVVAVSAPHRGESFPAADFGIAELKKTAPIWKKEIWEGGSEWVKGC